jgi:hypothetical protein
VVVMTDLDMLAGLSHDLEAIAMTLVADGIDGRVVVDELVHQADGEREVAAIALSYLLRRRNLGETPPPPRVLDASIDAMVTAIRRMPPAPSAPAS